MLTEAEAWQVLRTVPDPEIPVISVCELGIVRAIRATDDALTVVVTPTYSGCPATEVIAASIRTALGEAGAATVSVETQLSPAWTTDWIEADAAARLRAYGIVPPNRTAETAVQTIRLVPRAIACPRCDSRKTTRLAAFGSTACKALWRCEDCMEPFEEFKPL